MQIKAKWYIILFSLDWQKLRSPTKLNESGDLEEQESLNIILDYNLVLSSKIDNIHALEPINFTSR